MFLFKLKWPSILILSLKDTLTNIDHVSLTKNQIFLLKCPQAIFFMKKLEKTEEDIFGALKKRKDAKKTKSNKNQLDGSEASSSDSDNTFEEFFSSSDESSNEVLQEETSDENKDS